MNRQKFSFLVFFCFLLFHSCTPLKPYEMVYVNDPEMQMGADAGKNFQTYIQSIREGATPAGTSKASGGCGCN
jgi:hypothetical protein